MTRPTTPAALDAARLRYLRDCYHEDHRSQAILDLYAKKIEKRQLLDAERWRTLAAGAPQIVGTPTYLIAKTARLYRAEKTLLVGRTLILGAVRGRDGDGQESFCAPLWLDPIDVGTDPDTDAPTLTVATDRSIPNHPLLSLLADRWGVEPEQLERLERSLPRPALDDDVDARIAETARLLTGAFDGLVIDPPPEAALDTQSSWTQLRRNVKRRELGPGMARITVCSAAFLLLVRQGLDTRGVAYELAKLASQVDGSEGVSRGELSAPVRALFGYRIPPSAGWSTEANGTEVPAILSPAQQRALDNAAREALSLIIGPPGTGKSFTIAAVALDALSRGESVLVASKTDTAVDVVAGKLEGMLGMPKAIVRGGRRGYGRALKEQLLDLAHLGVAAALPSTGEYETAGPVWLPPKIQELRDERAELDEMIADLAHDLQRRSRDEIHWGELDAGFAERGGWRPIQRLQRWVLGHRVERSPAYWAMMEQYRTLLEERVQFQGVQLRDGILRRLDTLLRHERSTVRKLAESVQARTVERRSQLWGKMDAKVLLGALPIWLVKLSDVSGVLPLASGLFDVVILDEATQCDLASSLPVLHRGQRAVVVGDPKQLRHLSFLAGARQARIGELHGLEAEDVASLDYRRSSVLDRVDSVLDSQDRVAHLDEHFRSVPAIIGFSNRQFYSDRLRVMQEHPAHDYRRALYLHRIDGVRDEDGINAIEAEAVVAGVARLITATRPSNAQPTIGVLSPFRAQVERLGQLLTERFNSHVLGRHDLRVGTPYAFQGAERDVMFLSFALDRESHPSAFRYLERADVFNVAVTRARNRQEVFVSIDRTDAILDRSPLLARFLEYMQVDGLSPAPRSEVDPFLVEVRHRLEVEGFRAWPAYSIAGMEVDLVVERDGACLGIDLIGYPGTYAGAFELERYRLFNRAGLRLFPLPFSAWRRDLGACVRAIVAASKEVAREDRARNDAILV